MSTFRVDNLGRYKGMKKTKKSEGPRRMLQSLEYHRRPDNITGMFLKEHLPKKQDIMELVGASGEGIEDLVTENVGKTIEKLPDLGKTVVAQTSSKKDVTAQDFYDSIHDVVKKPDPESRRKALHQSFRLTRQSQRLECPSPKREELDEFLKNL